MKKNKTESVSIILPCAGRGTRLNLPYPKELIKINEGMSVIDYSFHHILASRIKPRVVVIIGPHKFDTVQYLYEKYNNKLDLVFVFQKTDLVEITGAVRSAEHLFGDKNILLMPDTIIEYKDKKTSLIDKMLETLDRQSFVFACKDETSATRLRSLGALKIENGKVVGYENKPLKNIGKYNAFWVSYGFTKEVFGEVISVIEQNALKKSNFRKVFQKSSLYKLSPIRVSGSDDISTWTNLNAYLLKQYLLKSGIDSKLLKTRSK